MHKSSCKKFGTFVQFVPIISLMLRLLQQEATIRGRRLFEGGVSNSLYIISKHSLRYSRIIYVNNYRVINLSGNLIFHVAERIKHAMGPLDPSWYF